MVLYIDWAAKLVTTIFLLNQYIVLEKRRELGLGGLYSGKGDSKYDVFY